MLQPLSLGDSFAQEEMKRLSGGKSLSSSPSKKKKPCFLASENYNYRSSITKYVLERCLGNLNLFNHGLFCRQSGWHKKYFLADQENKCF